MKEKAYFAKTLRLFCAAFLTTTASFTVLANIKYYEADMQTSQWDFEGNPLQCHLSHNIPLYGQAAFRQSAGQQSQLDFLLSYKRHPLKGEKTAQVVSIAPAWQPLRSSKPLGQIKLKEGRYVVTSQSIASWQLLYELEAGRFPTFSYQDLPKADERVSVALSSVRFRNAFEDFLDCVSSLVKYDLKQISRMTLYFDFDKHSIRPNYQAKLDALAAYVKYDPSIEVVFIDGHTDSKGSRSYNEKLAKKRIQSVKKILQLDGVPDEKFKTHNYGEKKPAATNRNARGRAQNRRVYIKIAQI
jgi:sodium-type flagellar protein MotY